jgi:lactoylglutathione lyase
MHIEHVAIWTHDIERLRAFYEEFFEAEAGARYVNPTTGFRSYFLSFEEGARLELMQMPGIPTSRDDAEAQATGYIHLALTAGEPGQVDALTGRLEAAGYRIAGAPRWTGDGYYESVVLDPDGNRVEIVAELGPA